MTPQKLLWMMLPGLAPLLVYVVASELWGDLVGLAIAVALALLEFVAVLVLQKRVEAFVAVDLGILIVTGAVSLWSGDDLFFRLKPVLMEAILLVFLGLSAWGPKNLLLKAAFRGPDGERLLETLNSNAAASKAMQRNLTVLTVVVAAHTGLSLAAALWMSKEAWAFITGVLLYLLLGAVVLIQVVRRWTFHR